MMKTSTEKMIILLCKEIAKADADHGPKYASYHEAYGVLKEEVDEFWEEVRLKEANRKPENLRHELIQVAAVAIRAARMVKCDDKED